MTRLAYDFSLLRDRKQKKKKGKEVSGQNQQQNKNLRKENFKFKLFFFCFFRSKLFVFFIIVKCFLYGQSITPETRSNIHNNKALSSKYFFHLLSLFFYFCLSFTSFNWRLRVEDKNSFQSI